MAQVNKSSTLFKNSIDSIKESHSWNSCYIDQESLTNLENLINEFFLPATSNDRKRHIEVILNEFSSMPNSWQMSFIYFESTSNEYTKMFCLTVIETYVNQQWHTLPSDVRTSFRSSLWKYLFENHPYITSSIRNKFCKILSTIALHDWPYHYPDFMSNILELLTPDPGQNILHSATLILLGLNLLGTAVEELTSNNYVNNHFSSKTEFVKMLQSNLPNMLQALTLLLESIISKHISYYSATPPPSPTSVHNSVTGSNNDSCQNILSNIAKTKDTLGNVFQISLKKGLLHSIPEMDHEFVNLTSQIFVCLSQIIDFMPVTYFNSINSTLLSALYVLATFGSINPSYNSSKLGLISMNCINELMSKASTFDSQANDFIYSVFQNTFLILQLIISSTSSKTLHNGEIRLDEIDEEYLKKFIDFLKLFITNHLGRFEKFISFPIKDFLQLLLEFTTKMRHSQECYLMLIETWLIYFDYVENFIDSKQKDKAINNERLTLIKEPVFAFLTFVLSSIQYNCNGDYLKQLDDSSVDDDGRTDLENYLFQSIEIISKIAEIFPGETISCMENYFNEKLQNIYYGLEFLVNNNKPFMNGDQEKLYSSTPRESLSSQPIEQLKLRIHDFIIMLQVFSRFSVFFVDLQFEKYFVRTKIIFDKLCEILNFIEAHKFDDSYRNSCNPLLNDFLLLKAQIIATFKAYIIWFQQVCYYGSDKSIEMSQIIEHITIIISCCCSIICDNIDHNNTFDPLVCESQKKMFHSAALTLNSLSCNVRPSFVFDLNPVQRLFDQSFQSRLLNLDGSNNNENKKRRSPSLTDQILISQAISNFLILPWFRLENEAQNWDRRSIYLNMFVGNFLRLFNNLDLADPIKMNALQQNDDDGDNGGDKHEESRKCPNSYCRSLYILKQVISSHSDSPLKSKELLLLSLNSSLEAFIQLLVHEQKLHSTVIGCQITRHILALFIVVFKVLLPRIHMDFVQRTIQTLLQIINRHNVMASDNRNEQSSTSKETTGLRVIIKFLKLLILVIGQTSLNSFLRSILPEIIDFAVIHIQNNLISIKSTMGMYFRNQSGVQYDAYHKLLKVYYRFLYELVLNNCRYFFPQRLNHSVLLSTITNHQNHRSMIEQQLDNNNSKNITDSRQQRQFDLIMEIFGESFMQPENIHLFRQNVEALESLNFKMKLYERPSFRCKFLERFLYLFMQTMLDHSLALLNESLYTIIYHLAQVDFVIFHDSFVPNYISNLTQLNIDQRMELMKNFKIDQSVSSTNSEQIPVDLPTFSAKLNQLLSNIRFFYKCNVRL